MLTPDLIGGKHLCFNLLRLPMLHKTETLPPAYAGVRVTTSVVSSNYLVGFKRLPRRSGFQPDTISFYFSTIVGLEARPTRPKETVT